MAEKRKVDIEKFLVSLFKMADEIAHSDIVYTFFHPLLRDQEESDINIRKVKGKKNFFKWFDLPVAVAAALSCCLNITLAQFLFAMIGNTHMMAYV